MVGMGKKVGITKIDKRGRATIPQEIREDCGLKPGQELLVEKRTEGIILRPLMSRDDFVRELEGCITETNQQAKISPEKLKEIWEVGHSH